MIRLWLAAKAAGIPLPFFTLLGMRLRRAPMRPIVEALIGGTVAGVRWPIEVLEAHALAGGDPTAVMRAAILLRKAKAAVDRETLLAGDLRGLLVVDLAAAYVKRREQLPRLEFDEVLDRGLQGEDVRSSLTTGSFLPRSDGSGWRARLEFGPLTGAELKEFLHSGDLPPGTTVWDPQKRDWIGVTDAKRQLGLILPHFSGQFKRRTATQTSLD